MSEAERQYEMHKQLHAQLAAAVRPFLEKGLSRSLVIGAFEDVKLVATESYLARTREGKADET